MFAGHEQPNLTPDEFNVFPRSLLGRGNRYVDFRPRYPETLFDYLAKLVPRNSVVWDCAAGNGQASVDLAKHYARVIATDGSKEQIAAAMQRPNVEYRVATAEESGLADASVDMVTVAQAVHWFDFSRFYSEVRRVLKPGGVLAIWAYGITEIADEAINRVTYEFYSEIVGPFWPPQRMLVEEGYCTIPFPFEEITPPVFAMSEQWSMDDLLGYFSTWSATNRYIKSNGESPIGPLREKLLPLWGPAEQRREIRWPIAMRVGRT